MKKESLTSKKTILTKPFMIEPSKRFDYKFSKNKFKTKSKGSSQHSSENYGQHSFEDPEEIISKGRQESRNKLRLEENMKIAGSTLKDTPSKLRTSLKLEFQTSLTPVICQPSPMNRDPLLEKEECLESSNFKTLNPNVSTRMKRFI